MPKGFEPVFPGAEPRWFPGEFSFPFLFPVVALAKRGGCPLARNKNHLARPQQGEETREIERRAHLSVILRFHRSFALKKTLHGEDQFLFGTVDSMESGSVRLRGTGSDATRAREHQGEKKSRNSHGKAKGRGPSRDDAHEPRKESGTQARNGQQSSRGARGRIREEQKGKSGWKDGCQRKPE